MVDSSPYTFCQRIILAEWFQLCIFHRVFEESSSDSMSMWTQIIKISVQHVCDQINDLKITTIVKIH